MDSSNLWPIPENIVEFSYSKRSHFELFRSLPFRLLNVGAPEPEHCDLKVYQDYLSYCFICRNIPAGARILEIGGGDSRVLHNLSGSYECWNLDRFEGVGNGPVHLPLAEYRIVRDFIGAFSRELPNRHFDLVFSISVLEHTPERPESYRDIVHDIQRLLKPAAPSFHCIDATVGAGGFGWLHGLIPFLYAEVAPRTSLVTLSQIDGDRNTFAMSRSAYEMHWQPITGRTYDEFGRPFSLNVLWYGS